MNKMNDIIEEGSTKEAYIEMLKICKLPMWSSNSFVDHDMSEQNIFVRKIPHGFIYKEDNSDQLIFVKHDHSIEW